MKHSGMWKSSDFSMDFSGLMQLYSWVENFEEKYGAFLERFLIKAGLRALAKTKKRTLPGQYEADVIFWARKSLEDADGELNLVELEGAGAGLTGGTLRRAWKLTNVKRKGDTLEITLYADPAMAPYALYVEYGHRQRGFNSPQVVGWVEGKHMAEISIKELERQLPGVHDRAFKKFIDSLAVE